MVPEKFLVRDRILLLARKKAVDLLVHRFFVSFNFQLQFMETITVHPQNKEQSNALEIILKAMNVPFEKEEESPYNPEFLAKIKRGEKAAKEEKTMKVNVANLWK